MFWPQLSDKQITSFLRPIRLSSVARLLYYIFAISRTARFSGQGRGGGGGGGVLGNKICFDFLILSIIQRDITKVYRTLRKIPVILIRCRWKFNFIERFSKTPPISNFIKICPLGAELFHVD